MGGQDKVPPSKLKQMASIGYTIQGTKPARQPGVERRRVKEREREREREVKAGEEGRKE